MEKQNILIDKILSYISEIYPKLPTYGDLMEIWIESEDLSKAIDKMEKLMLIGHHKSDKERYTILKNGYEVLLEGGWLDYNRKKEEYRQLQVDNIKASITTNKNVKANIWLTLTVAVFTGIGTGIQAYIAYRDRQERLEKEEKSPANHIQMNHKYSSNVLPQTKIDTTDGKSSK